MEREGGLASLSINPVAFGRFGTCSAVSPTAAKHARRLPSFGRSARYGGSRSCLRQDYAVRTATHPARVIETAYNALQIHALWYSSAGGAAIQTLDCFFMIPPETGLLFSAADCLATTLRCQPKGRTL